MKLIKLNTIEQQSNENKALNNKRRCMKKYTHTHTRETVNELKMLVGIHNIRIIRIVARRGQEC